MSSLFNSGKQRILGKVLMGEAGTMDARGVLLFSILLLAVATVTTV